MGKQIHKFYNVDSKIDKLNSEINWTSHLDELLTKCLNWDVCAIARAVAINLKRKSIMPDKCVEILRKIGKKNKANFDDKEYLLKSIRN